MKRRYIIPVAAVLAATSYGIFHNYSSQREQLERQHPNTFFASQTSDLEESALREERSRLLGRENLACLGLLLSSGVGIYSTIGAIGSAIFTRKK